MKFNKQLMLASWNGWIADDARPAGPRWLQWLWVLLFSLAMAFVFTALGFLMSRGGGGWSTWLGWFGKNLVVCLLIVALIQGLHETVRWLFGGPAERKHWQAWQRTLVSTGIPVVGVILGWPLGVMLVGMDLRGWLQRPDGLRMVASSIGLAVVVTLIIHRMLAAKARLIDSERRTTEAQLRLLQAQMEPHFLFNTLANVQSLIAHDATRAQAMLGAFTDYLRASLMQMRRTDGTLGDEVDLATAYLELMRERMGERLRYRIEVDAAARRAVVPALMLQPLVENAIHHGLEPKVDGGLVTITGKVEGDLLVLQVLDDGLGLGAADDRVRDPRRHAGMALENLRARLASRHGEQAGLTLVAAQPGTLATLRLPYEVTPKPDAPEAHCA